jgi:ribonuclease D
MSTEIRTFIIPDDHSDEVRETLAHFLRSVEVQRIDTAYAAGAWRVLVLFQDLRHKEEAKQIESAISGALNAWRDRAATRDGITPEEVLPEAVVTEIARFAPTTEHELSVIAASANLEQGGYGGEIVQVVRATLEDLID